MENNVTFTPHIRIQITLVTAYFLFISMSYLSRESSSMEPAPRGPLPKMASVRAVQPGGMKPDARLSVSLVEDGESPGANGATGPASRAIRARNRSQGSNPVGGRQNMRGRRPWIQRTLLRLGGRERRAPATGRLILGKAERCAIPESSQYERKRMRVIHAKWQLTKRERI